MSQKQSDVELVKLDEPEDAQEPESEGAEMRRENIQRPESAVDSFRFSALPPPPQHLLLTGKMSTVSTLFKHKHEELTDDVIEETTLRRQLRVFFHTAFHFRDSNCTVNVMHVIIMILQVAKAALLSAQLIRFGGHREGFEESVHRGDLALHHTLLKDWSVTYEGLPYPPAGDYAVYNQTSLKEHINYAVTRYYGAQQNGIGVFDFTMVNGKVKPMELCITWFNHTKSTSVVSSDVSVTTHRSCTDAIASGSLNTTTNETTYSYDIDAVLRKTGELYKLTVFLRIELTFQIYAIRVTTSRAQAQCLDITGRVQFVDSNDNGQALVSLDTNTSQVTCASIHYNIKDYQFGSVSRNLAIGALTLTALSTATTLCMMVLGFWLAHKTKVFQKRQEKKAIRNGQFYLKWNWVDYLNFFRLWDVFTIVGDQVTTYGIIKIEFLGVNWTLCYLDDNTIYMGMGCIIAWLVLLRYFKFHTKFNILFSTLYHAGYNVVAYLACVVMLFSGFVVCGYVVLGPYHVKFQTISNTAECLFSLINGDDIYGTLANLETSRLGSESVWYFSRFYLCTYIAVFTVLVINLLIAIFTSAFNDIQDKYAAYKKGKERNPLRHALRHLLSAQEGQSKEAIQLRIAMKDFLRDLERTVPEEEELRQELMQLLVKTVDDQKGLLKKFRDGHIPHKLREPCCSFGRHKIIIIHPLVLFKAIK